MGHSKVAKTKDIHTNECINATREDHFCCRYHGEHRPVGKSDIDQVTGCNNFSTANSHFSCSDRWKLKVRNDPRGNGAVCCSSIVEGGVFFPLGLWVCRKERGEYFNFTGEPERSSLVFYREGYMDRPRSHARML